MEDRMNRRRLLAAAAAATLFSISGRRADAAAFSAASGPELCRVRMTIQLNGTVRVPKGQTHSSDEARTLPLEAESVVDYEERVTRDDEGRAAAARRYYHTAESSSVVKQQSQKLQIRNEARQVVAREQSGRFTVYGDQNHLTHDELQLLSVPVEPLAVERLLASQEIEVGSQWKPAAADLATLFNLDAVQQSDVSAKVNSIEDREAKLEMSGTLKGSVDGVATSIQMISKFTLDQRQKTITWFAVSMREQREIGKAEPGFDVTAQIRVIRKPLEEPTAIQTDEPVVLEQEIPPQQQLVLLTSDSGWEMLGDRRWRPMSDGKLLTVLRMIDQDRLIAGCNVQPLPPLPEGQHLSLEGFEEDIRAALGDRLDEIAEASQQATPQGVRVLRCVVLGRVQEVPIQWVYLHFSDDSGRRSSAIVTMDGARAEEYAAADVQMSESFRFTTPEEPEQPADGTSRSPESTRAAAKSSDSEQR